MPKKSELEEPTVKNEWPTEWTFEVWQKLLRPFSWDEVEWLARIVTGDRCLAIAYIDARAVMNRLDEVVGPPNWSYTWKPVTDNCKGIQPSLTVLGKTCQDAGEAGKEDEPVKAAISDGLKRVAVHFGIGRYLYYMPQRWVAYDSKKRQVASVPKISDKELAEIMKAVGYVGDISEAASPRPKVSERPLKDDRTLPGTEEDGPLKDEPAHQDSFGQSMKCSDCDTALTEDAFEKSKARFGRPLCVPHAKAQFEKDKKAKEQEESSLEDDAEDEDVPEEASEDGEPAEETEYEGEEEVDIKDGDPAIREGKIAKRVAVIAKNLNRFLQANGHAASKQVRYRAFAVNNEGHKAETKIQDLSALPNRVSHKGRMWDQVELWSHMERGVEEDLKSGKLVLKED